MTFNLPLPAERLPRGRSHRMAAAVLTSLIGLGGCASLPSSGPTATEVVGDSHAPGAATPFDILEISEAVVAGQPRDEGVLRSLADLPPAGPADIIGPGDALQISIFEVGPSLFSGRSSAATASAGEPNAAGENLPLMTVGRDGLVAMPYVGPVQAAGLTTDALAAKIQKGLSGKSQAPQVVVSIKSGVASTAMVLGDVKKPGRIALTLAGEHVLDAIADAGGPVNPTPDNLVRLTRGSKSAIASLAFLHSDSPDDVALQPQDRVEVEYRPRTFTIFGAAGKVQEIPFQTPRVSLAEAIARAGGPSDQQADPTAVFVFRYEPAAIDGAPLPGAKPVAYRLNLRQARSYLLAQRFEMKSRDVIYIANASIVELGIGQADVGDAVRRSDPADQALEEALVGDPAPAEEAPDVAAPIRKLKQGLARLAGEGPPLGAEMRLKIPRRSSRAQEDRSAGLGAQDVVEQAGPPPPVDEEIVGEPFGLQPAAHPGDAERPGFDEVPIRMGREKGLEIDSAPDREVRA